MEIALSVWLVLTALGWGWALLASVRTGNALPRLEPVERSARATWPRVEVVVPARDEEADIADSLARLSRLDYPDLGIIAVNDRSTDATGALMDAAAASDPRLRVLHIDHLPEGWLGKVHAMARASELATGDWLLFCDADVKFEPGSLETTVHAAETAGLDLLTAFPRLLSMGLVADTTLIAMSTLAMPGGRLWEASDPSKPTPAGFGAFLLVRRSHLDERTPGIEWLRLEVADDVGLGLLVKQHGGRIGVYNAARLLSLRWYSGYMEMARRMEKNWFVIMGRCSPIRTALVGLAGIVAGLSPLLALIPDLPLIAAIAGATAFLLQVLAGTMFVKWLGRKPGLAVAMPLGCTLVGIMACRAAWRGWRDGGVRWRDTYYPSDQLRRVQRVRF